MPTLETDLDLELLFSSSFPTSEDRESIQCIVNGCFNEGIYIAILDLSCCVLPHCLKCKDWVHKKKADIPGKQWFCLHDRIAYFVEWRLR